MKQAISGAMANRKGTMKIGVQNSTKKPPKTMLPKIVTKVAQNRLQTAFKVKVVGAWHSSERATYRVDGPSPAGFTKRPLPASMTDR
jgi:hypothetical protein